MDNRIIDLLLIVIVIIITTLYLIGQKYAPNLKQYVERFYDDLNWVPIEEIFQKADNGDLIFLSGDTRGERTCRFCTDSIFSHIAFLFKEIHPETGENILYVWESDLGQRSKDGPRILPFKEKMKRYHGYPYLMWRRLEGERPTTRSIMETVHKYAHYDFDHQIFSWWSSEGLLSPLYYFVKDDKKVFCSELVALTLQDLNIVDRGKKAAWYSPKSFSDENIIGLHKNYRYGERCFSKWEL